MSEIRSQLYDEREKIYHIHALKYSTFLENGIIFGKSNESHVKFTLEFIFIYIYIYIYIYKYLDYCIIDTRSIIIYFL